MIVASVYVFLVMLYARYRPFFNGAGNTRMVIYEELCNGCGNCVIVCPSNALRSTEASGGKGSMEGMLVMDISDGNALEFNINLCERVTKPNGEPCKLCYAACPLDAIDFTY